MLIARIVRAAGMNVVCRLDAELASTARNSSRPSAPPSTGSASAAKTLSEVSGLPRPTPSSPAPAYICAAIVTSR